MGSDFFSQGVLYRACSRCGKAYPLDAAHFHRKAGAPAGFRPACRACSKAAELGVKRVNRIATARARELHAKLESSAAARRQMLQIIKEASGARVARETPGLGLRVADFCDRTGMTYAEFARSVGADWQTVYQWANGVTPVGAKHALDVLLYVGDRPQGGVAS